MPIGPVALLAVRQSIAQTLFDTMRAQAISNVRLIREPTAVTVKFDTVHPAYATVEIFRMVHGELSLDMEKENLVRRSTEVFGSAQDSHAVLLPDLEQEHRYWYRISVPRKSPAEPGATGHVRFRGEFATPRRDSFVDIARLHIVNDSDTTSAGDLRFSAAIYDATSSSGGPRLTEPLFTSEQDHDSGDDFRPFSGFQLDRAPNRIGILVIGQDDDTNLWAGPWQGLPIVGMRPPPQMPAQATSFSNEGFDGTDALATFGLKRFLGSNTVPFGFSSAAGALSYEVFGNIFTTVKDTLRPRTLPPWKLIVRSMMKLTADERPSGRIALPERRIAFALTPDAALTRATGPRDPWQELEGPALDELLLKPTARGPLILVGRGEGGRLYLASLIDPEGDAPRWQALDLRGVGLPVMAEGPEGEVHLTFGDPDGGLWHGRIEPGSGEAPRLTQLAKRLRGEPVAAIDRDGGLTLAFTSEDALRLLRLDRDGRVAGEGDVGGEFPVPLALVEDEAEMLLAAADARGRVAVRQAFASEAGWEALGSLDEVLEGPLPPLQVEA